MLSLTFSQERIFFAYKSEGINFPTATLASLYSPPTWSCNWKDIMVVCVITWQPKLLSSTNIDHATYLTKSSFISTCKYNDKDIFIHQHLHLNKYITVQHTPTCILTYSKHKRSTPYYKIYCLQCYKHAEKGWIYFVRRLQLFEQIAIPIQLTQPEI